MINDQEAELTVPEIKAPEAFAVVDAQTANWKRSGGSTDNEGSERAADAGLAIGTQQSAFSQHAAFGT